MRGKLLELGQDGGGRRYYLAGRAVHNGDRVEVAMEGGGWLEVRLEGMPQEILAYGFARLDGGVEVIAKLPAVAGCRWPEAGVGWRASLSGEPASSSERARSAAQRADSAR